MSAFTPRIPNQSNSLAIRAKRSVFVLNAWSLPLWLSSGNRARQKRAVVYIKERQPYYRKCPLNR